MTSAIIIAAIILIAITVFILLFRFLHQFFSKKDNNALYDAYSEYAIANEFTASSEVLINDTIIAIDGKKRSILVVKNEKELKPVFQLIALDDVKQCAVQEEYCNAMLGYGWNKKEDTYINNIHFKIDCKNKEKSVSILFYEYGKNSPLQLPIISRQARNLEILFNKLLKKQSTADNYFVTKTSFGYAQ